MKNTLKNNYYYILKHPLLVCMYLRKLLDCILTKINLEKIFLVEAS